MWKREAIQNMTKNELKKPGIYLLTNTENGLLYIGKSKNIHQRWSQYKSIIRGNIPSKTYNTRFINHLQKYNFDFKIIEFLEHDDSLLSEKEIYWINYYESNNKLKGYNLNINSKTKTFISEETRELIRTNVTNQWKNGFRKEHTNKLKISWINRDKEKQANILRNNITVYKYIVTFTDGSIKEMFYKELKEYKLQNCIADFFRKQTNIHLRKDGIKIERICIEDIVQPSVKIEEKVQ